MSSRTIVSLGVWILLMVLVGTLTVGMALAFYVSLTLFCAVAVGVLMLLNRRQAQPPGGDQPDAPTPPATPPRP